MMDVMSTLMIFFIYWYVEAESCYTHEDGTYINADCSNLGLTSVPENLTESLTHLDLSENFIEELKNSSFERYGRLLYLSLRKNRINRIESDAFWNQTELNELDLSDNDIKNITKQLVPELVQPLTNLLKLDLRRSQNMTYNPSAFLSPFVYPVEALSQLKNLTNLYMDLTPMPIFGSDIKKLTKLKVLAFDTCLLIEMLNSTFQFFPGNITELHLMKCHHIYQKFEYGFLSPFKNLKVLNLADTYIHLTRALNLLFPLANSKMDVINFQHVSYELNDNDELRYTLVVDSAMMKYLRTICVKTLNLADNGIVDFGKNSLFTYDHPECFENMVLSANRFTFHVGRKAVEIITLVKKMVNLKLFDFSYNPIRFSNETYLKVPNGEVTFDPKSTGCKMEAPPTPGNLTIPIPPKLKTLRFSHFLRQSCGVSVVIYDASSLEYLDMSFYQFQRFPDVYIFGEINLKFVNLSGVDVSLYVHKQNFPLFHSVINGSFRYAEIGMKPENSEHLLKIFPFVQVLDISFNSIWTLPKNLFFTSWFLTDVDLSHNMLHELPLAVKNIANLKNLNLQYNNLVSISKEMRNWFDSMAKSHHLVVKLTGNVFSCSCENRDFVRWLNNTKVILDPGRNYSCRLSNGNVMSTRTVYENYHQIFKDCNAELWMKVGISSLASFCIIALIFATVFNFRWRIAFFIYRKFRMVIESKMNLCYKYDAYVSFAEDGEEWVKEFLVQKAEQKWGLKLCIDDRDLLGGTSEIDSVAESIGSSRQVLFVLTSGLLQREWTAYEVERAKYEKINKHVQITVLNLGIDITEVPQEFSAIWNDVCLIEWNDMPTFSDVAWGKLKTRLFLNR